MNGRPSIHEYFLAMAVLVSTRGACVRRRTGCVLVDRHNFVLATGYNGRSSGVINCLQSPCKGFNSASGTNLEGCEAIHAEANAIIQCKDTQSIATAYCTHSPCIHCVKLLMNTSCNNIVFLEPYAHDQESQRLWKSRERKRISSYSYEPERPYGWYHAKIYNNVLAKVVDAIRLVQ